MGNARDISCGETAREIYYHKFKDEVTIQYKAIHNGDHIATIIVWSHKVNKRCVVIWKHSKHPMQLCESETGARNFVENRRYR